MKMTHNFWCFATIALSLLVSGCDNGEPANKSWKYANQGILSADIAQSGSHALIGSIHHGGSYWEIETGERLFNWNHKQGEYSSLRAAALSGNGKVAATAERDAVVVWDTNSGKYKAFWKVPDVVLSMKLSTDGNFALIGLRNNTASYFNLIQGGSLHTLSHEDEIRGVDLSLNGKFAITGSDDMTVKIWDLSNGKEIFSHKHGNQIKTVAISQDGSKAFSSAQREDALIWDVKKKTSIALDYHYENFTSARFSSNGDRLLLGTFQGRIYLVDTKTGKELKRWHSKTRKIWGGNASSKTIISVAFGRQNTFYALASDGIMGRYK